jgi:hypothetical protein
MKKALQLGLLGLFACARGADAPGRAAIGPSTAVGPTAATPTTGSATATLTEAGAVAENAPPDSAPACADGKYRVDETLVRAWRVGDRVFYCSTWDDENGQKNKGKCGSVDRSGARREEPRAEGKAAALPGLASIALKKTGRDNLSFTLQGGKREPHGATGHLKVGGKLTKTAPIEYDEHIAIEGWIGNGLVFETWVDEGPGCVRSMVDPRVGWPTTMGVGPDTEGLSGCHYHAAPYLRANDKEIAVVDTDAVRFVDETSLRVTAIETGTGTNPSDPYAAWTYGDEVVLAQGNPNAGDVTWINLKTHAKTTHRAQRTCR